MPVQTFVPDKQKLLMNVVFQRFLRGADQFGREILRGFRLLDSENCVHENAREVAVHFLTLPVLFRDFENRRSSASKRSLMHPFDLLCETLNEDALIVGSVGSASSSKISSMEGQSPL